MEQIADRIWRWTSRHPEWHPRTPFGERVASYALRDRAGTVLIDPLAPGGDVDGLVDALAGVLAGAVRIVVTIPYHVRSAEPLWRRLRETHDTTIRGHPAVATRLSDTAGFRAMRAGEAIEGGVLPIRIGNPRRYETPLHLPEHDALAFGDAVVQADGALRVWIQQPLTPARREWYRTRLRPSLQPLLEAGAERVLVTHGQPVMSGGRDALRAALDGEPWYHRPN